MFKNNLRTGSGFSLIELIISASLGSVMLAGIITAFDGFKKSSDLDRSITELQEQGRYAIDYLSERVRYRGFQGCLPPSVFDMTAIDSTNTDLIYEVLPVASDFSGGTLPETSLSAFDINAAGEWAPGFTSADTEIEALKNGSKEYTPKPGTDTITIRHASVATMPIKSNMTHPGSPIELDPGALSFSQGDYVFIGDCVQADLFQVSNDPYLNADIQLEHNSPSNTSNNLSRAYDTNAGVRQFISTTFFISESGRVNKAGDEIYSLFEMDINGNVLEVIDGVENMQVIYGVIDSSGQISFVASDHGDFNPRKIVSIRLGLLMRSRQASKSNEDTASYTMPGEVLGSATTISHDGGKYMRQIFQTTIQMRNRG